MASNRQETRKPTPFDAEIGEMVRNVMYRQKIGVRALSLRLRRHESTVGRLLRGGAVWRSNDLQAFADALGMQLIVQLVEPEKNPGTGDESEGGTS